MRQWFFWLCHRVTLHHQQGALHPHSKHPMPNSAWCTIQTASLRVKQIWSLMLSATLCHKSSEGGLLNYRQRCEQRALLTTSVMAVVNQCRSVLPLDAQTLLNRCRSITLEHRLIFQAGPIADTWHLLTWKPLDCDCGSMAPLRPSLSRVFFMRPWLLYCSPKKKKCLCLAPPVHPSSSPSLTLIGLLIGDFQGDDVTIGTGWQRACCRDTSV